MTEQTDDVQAVEKLGKARDAIVSELRKTIGGAAEKKAAPGSLSDHACPRRHQTPDCSATGDSRGWGQT
ncbi:MAG TPA: hypothetical protein DEF45_16980 [Rhodopirellula sp.]|nr:hypothetical protein [Rhodopirellula sp.]